MRLRAFIDKAIQYLVITLMSVLVIDVLWQVASRYLFKTPSSFTDELAGFLLIWVGLAGAAYATGTKQHLAIDLMLQKASGKKKRILEVVINSFIIVFALAVMVVGGTWLVTSRFILGQVSAALEIPLGYVYLIVPISGALIIYYCLDEIFRGKTEIDQ